MGRGETCLEGDGTISQRGETLREGDATVSQRGETLLERRHGRWARARRSGAIGQHAHGVGRGVEADLRLQARHPDALAEMPGSERRAQPENVRMDGSEDGDRRTGQCGVRRTRLRPCRFEHEPYTYRGDSNRNHATPPSNQEVPHSLPTSPGVTASVNVRPPTRAGASTAIAARIVRRDGVAVISYLGPPTSENRLIPPAGLPHCRGFSQAACQSKPNPAGAPSGMQSKAPGLPSAAHALKILLGLCLLSSKISCRHQSAGCPYPRRPKMVGMADHPPP